MIIHLDSDLFEIVKCGTKNIEARVNDEKRKRLKIGDQITILKRPADIEQITAIVEDLIYYDNFVDLVADYTIEELYLNKYTKEEYLDLLKSFYSDEEIKQYGTVAIKFRIMDEVSQNK